MCISVRMRQWRMEKTDFVVAVKTNKTHTDGENKEDECDTVRDISV